jgi:type I restriction enzyme R subunit
MMATNLRIKKVCIKKNVPPPLSAINNQHHTHLRSMLRESAIEDDEINLSSIELSHYRFSKIRRQDLKLREDEAEYGPAPDDGLGRASPRDKKEEFLSRIIYRLNECFISDELTDKDMLNYAYTVRDKMLENSVVMKQVQNNSLGQAMLGEFSKAMDDAIFVSSEAHHNQKMPLHVTDCA